MKASLQDISRALDTPSPDIRLFMLYGGDESGSAALAKRLGRAMGSGAERIDLDSYTLKTDPARLGDEAASFSLFGGNRYIRIQPATEECLAAIDAWLNSDVGGCPVVAVAGAMKPASALIKLALAHPAALAHISYPLRPQDAQALAEAMGREAGLRLSRDAARLIANAAEFDRSIMAQEIEKLALFLDAGPERPVEANSDAIAAIGADASEGELSRLVEAVFEGRPDQVAQEIVRLGQDGTTGIPLLRAAAKRAFLLTGLRSDVDAGASPGAAVKSRGKAIFWKDEASVTQQVSRWSAARLATAAARLLATERAIKSAGSLGDGAAEVELIAISRVAQRMR